MVNHEEYDWKRYLKLYPDFKRIEGESAYVYSAIFSPNDLDLTIIHEWQYYDLVKNKWITREN